MTERLSWYRAATRGDSVNAVAKRAGLVQTTLAAQVRRGELTPQSAVAIARAYEDDPLAALVAIGFLSDEEAAAHARGAALGDATDEELAREVWRRMASGAASEPITAAGPPPDGYGLAARRGNNQGAQQRQHLDTLGEETQDHGDWEPA